MLDYYAILEVSSSATLLKSKSHIVVLPVYIILT